jgi:hypothetical protein
MALLMTGLMPVCQLCNTLTCSRCSLLDEIVLCFFLEQPVSLW